MTKMQILAGPDRLAFVNSQFAEIDSVPLPGWMPPPHSRGGVQPPSYRGEAFLTKNEEGKERQLLLVITSSKRKGSSGMVQEFTAILWAVCDEFRDFLRRDTLGSWVEFRGELDFTTQNGWLERIAS
jgi:hypothetical protein